MKELSIEKQELLFKDLCSRLPYGVICKCYHTEYNEWDGKPFIATYDSPVDSINSNGVVIADSFDFEIDEVRPYLRPMSSMTEEERKEYNDIVKNIIDFINCPKSDDICLPITLIDWLNKHHFDYRGLIGKGLAIDMYK